MEEVDQTTTRLMKLLEQGLEGDDLRMEIRATLKRARRTNTSRKNRLAELARVRTAIGDSAEFYRQVLEAIPGGVVYVSAKGEVLEANAEAVYFLGLSYDDLVQSWVSDWSKDAYYEDGRVCPPEEYPVMRCLATGKPQLPMTLGIRQPDGTVGWATFTAVPVREAGEVLGAVVTFLDLSERKQVEQALERSRGQLETLVQHMPEHILEVDREGNVSYLNRASEGYTTEQVETGTLFDFSEPESHPRIREALRVVFEEQRPVAVVGRSTMGQTYATHYAPVFDVDRTVSKCMLIATDITDQRRAEEERRRLEARVQQAHRLESLGVLAGGIAHDFNNLLVGILGNVELALRQLDAASDTARLLEDARTTAQRASEMTHQLLAYSGRGKLRLEPLDLNAVVRETLQLLANTLAPSAEIEVELDDGLGLLEADVIQLRQVVLNLLTNASDALDESSGSITVRTRVLAKEHAVPSAATLLGGELTSARYALLEVEDTGAGIPTPIRERVFEPFYSTKFAGRGLGLAAVLGAVRGHDGRIAVLSQSGVGTQMRVLLPYEPVDPPTPERETFAASIPAVPAGTTVLVIDDERHVLQVARLVLESQGYHVVTAASGQEGLEAFAAQPVDLVLLDLLMPDMSGQAVLERLRADGHTVPVLLSSGCLDERPHTLQPDLAQGFLPKPYHIDELARLVAETLERRT